MSRTLLINSQEWIKESCMQLLLLLLLVKICNTEPSVACSRRTAKQVCARPSECPARYRRLKWTCQNVYGAGQIGGQMGEQLGTLKFDNEHPEVGELRGGKESDLSPTLGIFTSTVSSGVVTFPSVTNKHKSLVTEVPKEDCRRTGCQAPKLCDPWTLECKCPNFCQSLYPTMDLICGTDCRVYYNQCHFDTRQCFVGPSLLVHQKGFCPPRINPLIRITAGDRAWKVGPGLEVTPGSRVTLTCHVVSSQNHVVTWQRVDFDGNLTELTNVRMQISPNSTVNKVVSTAVLEMHVFEETDVGDYTCSATMCGVKETKTVTITIRPEYPVCTILSASFLRSYDGLEFRSRFQGDFILSMDRENYKWYILGRFKPCYTGSSDFCLHSVTVHDSMSGMSVYRQHRIHGDNLWQIITPGELIVREHKTAYRRGDTTVIELYTVEAGLVVVEWDNYMGVHITVTRQSPTGGLCGNNDADPDNDMLPRYLDRYPRDFEGFVRSWRISSRTRLTYNTGNVFETEFVEEGETLAFCQITIRELLLELQCVPENDKLELLVHVCVYEQDVQVDLFDRAGCNVKCYLKQHLQIMCHPAISQLYSL